MFDKLIESNSAEAEFKPRRKFFMVSSVVVGVLFMTAVVFSLYAQDVDLGTEEFDLAAIIAPVVQDAPEPEPPRQQSTQRMNVQQDSVETVRQILQERVDQPTQVPTEVSTIPNKYLSIPLGPFKHNPGGVDGDEIAKPVGTGTGTGSNSSGDERATVETPKAADPPPAPKVEKSRPPISLGPVNGMAKYLPKPNYPPPAIAVQAQGAVTVQVTIDEQGNVISAKAVSGHPFLRGVSEQAARSARFTPTLLSNVPVKVTGVITYNFKRQ